VREQIIVERMREREVSQRVRITDTEVEDYLEKQRGQRAGEVEYNIAQILIAVPEGASAAVVSERRALADSAMARVRGGEDFATVAKAVSQDANRERGGEIGLRPADRLPDLFLETVRPLSAGSIAPSVVRSGAGFHILKLVERRDASAFRVTQTRARHILLRVSDASNRDAAVRQMRDWRGQIERGVRRFEDIARERSEDGSASAGGDLGWASPGQFVPEFEQAMNPLPLGGLSEPVVSRFGVHLIQVVERREAALDNKQLRDQARAALREQKFEEAYGEWLKEMRSRAYVERREAPQL
jgi:peptidyl-prolyl cis-trans isomerase SurA